MLLVLFPPGSPYRGPYRGSPVEGGRGCHPAAVVCAARRSRCRPGLRLGWAGLAGLLRSSAWISDGIWLGFRLDFGLIWFDLAWILVWLDLDFDLILI